MIPFFFIIAALYIAVIVIFGKLGEKQRLLDRQELTGGENYSDKTTEETQNDT